jgi:hypothetical protein
MGSLVVAIFCFLLDWLALMFSSLWELAVDQYDPVVSAFTVFSVCTQLPAEPLPILGESNVMVIEQCPINTVCLRKYMLSVPWGDSL